MLALTSDDVRLELERLAEEHGSQTALAYQIGCSHSFLSEVIRSHREPSGPILAWLRLERQIRYVPVNGKQRKK